MKKYLNKKDILHWFKYGPMDFDFKQATFYELVFGLPIYTIIYWIMYFLFKNS